MIDHDFVQKVADDDAEMGRLRDQLEEVATRRALRIADAVSRPGQSVRRCADLLGISPTAVQKACDRARTATPASTS